MYPSQVVTFFVYFLMQNGKYLDSCIFLGSDSGYSVSRNDQVQLEGQDDAPPTESSRIINDQPSEDTLADRSTEFIIELQVKFGSILSFQFFLNVSYFFFCTGIKY